MRTKSKQKVRLKVALKIQITFKRLNMQKKDINEVLKEANSSGITAQLWS